MPRIRLLVLSVLIITASTQPVFLLGSSFFAIAPEFGLGPLGLGLLTAAFFLSASVSSTPLGRWVQRIGWQRAMVVNARASSILMLVIAVGARSVWVFAVLLVLAAGVYGMANPAANQALAEHTAPGRRATVFGIKHAGIPSSTLLAGFAVPAIVVSFGWRWAFVTSAILAFAVSLAVPRGVVEPSHRPEADDGVRRPMTVRWLIGLAAGSAFATWAAVALGTYLVSASVALGFSAAAAGWLQFGGSAASIGGRVVAGLVTDRIGGAGFAGVAILAGIGAVVFSALPFVAGAAFAALVVLGFMTGWGWPGLMTFTVVNANRRSAAASSAITQAGVFVGAGVGPIVLGAVIEQWSFDAGWWATAAGLAIAATVVGTVGRRLARLAA